MKEDEHEVCDAPSDKGPRMEDETHSASVGELQPTSTSAGMFHASETLPLKGGLRKESFLPCPVIGCHVQVVVVGREHLHL